MFKNLRTSTKLILLCTMFIISIAAATYSLIAEKQIAIAFARKELVGSRYLATLRILYNAVLNASTIEGSSAKPDRTLSEAARSLMETQNSSAPALHTAELAQSLSDTVRFLSSVQDRGAANSIILDVLTRAQQLASRIGDDSNLTLDPDLDTYYVQNIVAAQLPVFFSRLGELQIVSQDIGGPQDSSNGQLQVRLGVLEGLLRATTAEVGDNLARGYRGNADGSLKHAIDATFRSLFSTTDAYLGELKALDSGAGGANASPLKMYETVVTSATTAWLQSQSELDRLLRLRIDTLLKLMGLSLTATGILTGLSIVIAFMTHRHIVRPLEQLENVASMVRETNDYDLRIDYDGSNEIARLGSAFNAMLSELAAARDRERLEQSELARVARLTTAGAMTASIAHEINQPLAAIVANSNAAQRWLGKSSPDLDEVRDALTNIVKDGYRASQVIESVRAIFRKEAREKSRIDVNDLLADILDLIEGKLQRQRILVLADLHRDLPAVYGDRTQLQQVFMNLVTNAIDAMVDIPDRDRRLMVKSSIHDENTVLVTVQDSGAGIDPKNFDRIFDAFFTTKSDGMGMGLAICRSIIQAHGGRLWASAVSPRGTAFHIILPRDAPQGAAT
jgi:signal transduction histidine kinase